MTVQNCYGFDLVQHEKARSPRVLRRAAGHYSVNFPPLRVTAMDEVRWLAFGRTRSFAPASMQFVGIPQGSRGSAADFRPETRRIALESRSRGAEPGCDGCAPRPGRCGVVGFREGLRGVRCAAPRRRRHSGIRLDTAADRGARACHNLLRRGDSRRPGGRRFGEA
jgi:hypothetical protein